MLPIIQIGPLALQSPGLIILLGIWISLWISERHAHRFEINASSLYNLVLVAILAGLFGGRLFFIMRYPEPFINNPASTLSINLSLFDMSGALLSGLSAALVYGGRHKLPFWHTTDALTPGLAVFAISLALANLASGNGFGAPAQLPWAIELWGARRHPTQIYESISAVSILTCVLLFQRSSRTRLPGFLFLVFTAISAGTRLFLEAFRGDSLLIFNSVRTAQLIAWLILATSLWLLAQRSIIGTARDEDSLDKGIQQVG